MKASSAFTEDAATRTDTSRTLGGGQPEVEDKFTSLKQEFAALSSECLVYNLLPSIQKLGWPGSPTSSLLSLRPVHGSFHNTIRYSTLGYNRLQCATLCSLHHSTVRSSLDYSIRYNTLRHGAVLSSHDCCKTVRYGQARLICK